MSALVESIAYRAEGGLPWHGLGTPVENNMDVDSMLKAAGLDWSVSKRPIYFQKRAEDGELSMDLRVVPEEYALIRDSDEKVLDTVGENWNPTQNRDVFDFFKRFCEAGDMQMETAGALRGGRFVWALARIDSSFKIGKNDSTNGYLLLSQPHQFGFSLTAALTPVRVVCWNTITAALGSKLDGSARGGASFRMVHSRKFDVEVKAQAERALGLAHESMKAFGHTAELLSGRGCKPDDAEEYFRAVLQLEEPEDDTEAAQAEAEERENRNLKRFKEALLTAPGQKIDTANGTWWGAFNAVTYCVDHEFGRSNDNRLFSAWYGRGSTLKRRALELAVERVAA